MGPTTRRGARQGAPETPCVVAMGGRVASGKSTLARALGERLDAPVLEADRVREELTGDRPWQALEESLEDRVYEELLRRAREVLASHSPVVLDACFPREDQRARARALAAEHRTPFLFVEARVPEEVTRARLHEREVNRAERGWSEIARRLDEHWEPVAEHSREQHLVVDGTRDVAETLERIEDRLADARRAEAG